MKSDYFRIQMINILKVPALAELTHLLPDLKPLATYAFHT